MSLVKPLVLLLLFLTSACASVPMASSSRAATKQPLRGGIAEFQVTSYDGDTIKGRILLGATIDPLVIDGRLIEAGDVDMDMDTLQVCGNKEAPFQYVQFDTVARPARPDEIVTVRPGYWYGKNISYWLFAKKITGLGPDCIEAELIVRAVDGREAARVRIHVVRTDKPPAPPEGGAPAAPNPPAPDAGAP